MVRKHLLGLACLAVAPILSASAAYAGAPTTQPDAASKEQMVQQMQAMQAQMNQMQTQLQQTQSQLKQTQSQLQTTQQQQAAENANPQDSQAVVNQVMDDADKHSKLFSVSNGSAGFDSQKGFFIQTDDGNNYIHPGILFQGDSSNIFHPPYHWNTTGLVQLNADGNVFSKDVSFAFAFDEGGGTAAAGIIEYAEVSYTFMHNVLNHDLSFEVGRFKDAAWKETDDIGDATGIFMSDSIAAELDGGNDFGPQQQGVEFNFEGDDPLHAEAAITSGPVGAGETDGRITNIGVQNVIELTGRVDYKFFGDWVDTTDLTGKLSGKNNLLDVGMGIDYLNAHNLSWYRFDWDAQYQMTQQITAYGALYYNNFEASHNVGASRGAANDAAIVIEGGYDITPQIQALARYSYVRDDGHFPIPGMNRHTCFNELGVGGVYYFGPDGSWGNHMRFGMDFDYLPNGVPADGNTLYAPSADRGEWIIRSQFQFWI